MRKENGMNRPARFEGPKKATNVSLSVELVEEARKFGINVSEACQTGLAAEVKKARDAAWKEENRAAIESWNEYTRKHGLPLAKYRLF
jgi:antitoxin CcdA